VNAVLLSSAPLLETQSFEGGFDVRVRNLRILAVAAWLAALTAGCGPASPGTPDGGEQPVEDSGTNPGNDGGGGGSDAGELDGGGGGTDGGQDAGSTPTAPGAPTNVTGVPGNTQVVVSWVAPASNGGSAITSYTVTPFQGSTAGATVAVAGNVLTATVTGLTNGLAYTFTVKATNAIGEGPASAPSSAVFPGTVPGAPGTVTAVAGNGQATVSWTAPASTGGSPLNGYTITPFVGTTPGVPVSVDSAILTAVVSGLANGTAYTFKVKAVNAIGAGAESVSPVVTPAGPPSAPTGVTGVAGNGQVTVSWSAPAANGSTITQYLINTYQGSTPLPQYTAAFPSTSAPVGGLTNGLPYTFTVQAVNAIGTGPASAASAAITPRGPPGAPTGVTA
jgi:predicted phage tail protein